MTELTRCFWKQYQKTGRYEDMMKWLKHRAYIHHIGCGGQADYHKIFSEELRMTASDDELLAKAREMLPIMKKRPPMYKGMPHMEYTTLPQIIEDLIALAEKWQAITVEERANQIFSKLYARSEKRYFDGEKEIREYNKTLMEEARAHARQELAAEASGWRKIGDAEKEAVEEAIALMEECDHSSREIDFSSVDFDQEMDVLRRLLEGK